MTSDSGRLREEDDLTPLELDALRDCVKRGGTRCNDGGMYDTLLSILCSKPSREAPYVSWRVNPNSREDGYISLYEPTELGRKRADTPNVSGLSHTGVDRG